MWTEVKIGKYRGKGKTLPQIIFDDADWFFWAIEENVFKPPLDREAKKLNQRARHIKIPQKKGKEIVLIEYAVHPSVGKFGGLELVEESRPPHRGSTPTFRRGIIDMSIPRQIASYDKTGCKMLVKSLKYILFGNEDVRLTKQRCEEFFDNATNFELE